MHGGIKAAEKSAHPTGWKGEHVKHHMNVSRETRGLHKTTLLQAVCPSTISEENSPPTLSEGN